MLDPANKKVELLFSKGEFKTASQFLIDWPINTLGEMVNHLIYKVDPNNRCFIKSAADPLDLRRF